MQMVLGLNYREGALFVLTDRRLRMAADPILRVSVRKIPVLRNIFPVTLRRELHKMSAGTAISWHKIGS
jgi:hypothetical protein